MEYELNIIGEVITADTITNSVVVYYGAMKRNLAALSSGWLYGHGQSRIITNLVSNAMNVEILV